MQWDIFCRVIDNFGDIGVCWRLAVNLAQRGQRVRLWVDDASALAWMAPNGAPGVRVLPWRSPSAAQGYVPADVLVEAFGCEVDTDFIAAYANQIRAKGQPALWINLEYLSAEDYPARCHGLPSPVMSGPGRGQTKRFFYPGFTVGTGGLLREPDLLTRQAGFDRAAWLAQQGVRWQGERLLSLFCYEPNALPSLLNELAQSPQRNHLLVTDGRASAAVRQIIENKNSLQPHWNAPGLLSISYLPTLSQSDYDHLLWASDVNFVRGEDSLVRALWAGKPLIWQIYAQQDQVHHAKLKAWLDWLGAPASLRQAHALWNAGAAHSSTSALLPAQALAQWQATVVSARARLLEHNDLTSQLVEFACAMQTPSSTV